MMVCGPKHKLMYRFGFENPWFYFPGSFYVEKNEFLFYFISFFSLGIEQKNFLDREDRCIL